MSSQRLLNYWKKSQFMGFSVIGVKRNWSDFPAYLQTVGAKLYGLCDVF